MGQFPAERPAPPGSDLNGNQRLYGLFDEMAAFAQRKRDDQIDAIGAYGFQGVNCTAGIESRSGLSHDLDLNPGGSASY
jgi:hypothetical protein